MTSLRQRRASLSERIINLLDREPRTLPQLLDLLHRRRGGVDRIAEWDLIPVLSLLIEDGVIETIVADAKMGRGTTRQTHYVLRVI